MNIISLGAGIQSTTMLLMAAHGELSKPDYVIFADTGWEPEAVYKHLDWLKKEVQRFGLKIITVSNGNIKQDLLNGVQGHRFASIPFLFGIKMGPKACYGDSVPESIRFYRLHVKSGLY